MMPTHTDFALALPEIIVLALGSAILLVDAISTHPRRTLTYVLTMATLVLLAVVEIVQWRDGVRGSGFAGLYVTDSLAHLMKLASYAAVFVTLVYGRLYLESRDMLRGGELYVLALFSLLGQMVMISAGNLLTVYLGLELMSLALYALIALRRDDVVATEAAMKYFVLGALASGFLLYGMSMIYGATGHLDLHQVAATIGAGQAQQLPLVFGVVFLVAGLMFKLGAAPFHMWVPDVYQGSPTAVTLILGGAPKIAAFAITLRVLVTGMHGLAVDWQPMLMIVAVLSLAIGNITAIAQTNFKRMLAYSTISHMGFVVLGLTAGVAQGGAGAANAYGAALFYMITYVLTTLGSFGMVLLLSRDGFECDRIDDLKGLNRRSPWHAFVVLLLMVSLTGLPPTVGFYAKLAVLQPLVQGGQTWLAVVAVLFSLIGAFYYLRVVKVVYFDEPAGEAVGGVPATTSQRGLMALNGVLILALGLVPGGLMAACVNAVRASLGL
jgi:NADH-quinone oxidoreductase subunit N